MTEIYIRREVKNTVRLWLKCKSPEIISKSCLERKVFSGEWKKANMVLVYEEVTNNL